MKAPVKPLDFLVIGLSVCITILSAFAVYAGPDSAARAVIRGAGKTWIFPLDADEILTIPGLLGDTLVEIHGGKAAIISSPCNNQTCIATGHISRQGQWAACLPNNVFLLIEGNIDNEDAPDAAAW
jgi:hypothetical protein